MISEPKPPVPSNRRRVRGGRLPVSPPATMRRALAVACTMRGFTETQRVRHARVEGHEDRGGVTLGSHHGLGRNKASECPGDPSPGALAFLAHAERPLDIPRRYATGVD